MHLNIIALDLDGTLATDDTVAPETWASLEAAKKAGFTIILVTGRRLEVLPEIGPFDELCEAIVGENGAAVFFPKIDTVILPFGHLAPEVVKKLEAADMPLERGMAIAATWQPHDKKVIEVLSETGYAATVEYNKGAVMVLPPGATKGTGLVYALRELGYSPHNVVAVGDAENDRSFFEQAELAVAVSNACPEIKKTAEVVLDLPNGAGVRSVINSLMNGKVPAFTPRDERLMSFGKYREGAPLRLSPFYFLEGNLGIFGDSGSGKSWLGGLLAERLLQLHYQVCVIDPEGDYRGIRAFPNTLLLGGSESPPPPVADVTTLMEYSDISLILDLSLYSMKEQREYVTNLVQALCSLRARRGKPHWFLLDEVHYFCGDEKSPLTRLMKGYMQRGGFGLISYRPSLVAPTILSSLNHWLFTRTQDAGELSVLDNLLCRFTIKSHGVGALASLTGKQAYLCLGNHLQNHTPESGVIEFAGASRRVPHVRHLHKYLRAPLPESKRFYFHLDKDFNGPNTAASLWEFNAVLDKMPLETLQYHVQREDFEKWLRKILHDHELARRLRKIKNRNPEGELLREALSDTVAARFEELESLI